MPRKRILNHSEDKSQVHGRAGCNKAALILLARLIARAHLKKQAKKAVINGDGKSQRPHRKKKGGI